MRLLATGILLVVGLPILTMLLYLWGYPEAPVPPPIVFLVDGLQLLIVAYAVVVGVQLVVYAAAGAMRFSRQAVRPGRQRSETRRPDGAAVAASAPSSLSWGVLREDALRLADLMWLQEQRGRPEFGPAALAYVRDAVTLELEYRRREAALRRRAAELEAWAAQDRVVASERM